MGYALGEITDVLATTSINSGKITAANYLNVVSEGGIDIDFWLRNYLPEIEKKFKKDGYHYVDGFPKKLTYLRLSLHHDYRLKDGIFTRLYNRLLGLDNQETYQIESTFAEYLKKELGYVGQVYIQLPAEGNQFTLNWEPILNIIKPLVFAEAFQSIDGGGLSGLFVSSAQQNGYSKGFITYDSSDFKIELKLDGYSLKNSSKWRINDQTLVGPVSSENQPSLILTFAIEPKSSLGIDDIPIFNPESVEKAQTIIASIQNGLAEL